MIGQTVSHYKILEKLGEGGMGEVYLAEDTNLGRKVAVKFLSVERAADPEARRRFTHEARAQAMLSHSNIATFYEVGEEGNKVFIVMEYVEGQKLSELAKTERLPLPEILDLAIQVGEGLSAAHERGVMHRDINPTNILVTAKRVAKITDFGLAKWKGASTITKSNMQMGTDYYMSPEQVDERKADFRTDIFSFGVVLYELICARRPFEGTTQKSLFYEVLWAQPHPLARYCQGVSENLERIVFKCLAKQPEERYQSMADLVTDLKKEKKSIESGEPVYFRRKKRWKKLLPLLAPAAIGLIVVVIILFKGGNAEQDSLAVMNFENKPDPQDTSYTGATLTHLLSTSLSQAGGLEVISPQRVADIKEKLGVTDTTAISPALARKIAQRAGVRKVLLGTVFQTQPRLEAAIKLFDVESGRMLGIQRLAGFPSDSVFAFVDSMAILVGSGLRLSPAAVADIKPVRVVTTSSQEAYRAYAEGIELGYKGYIPEARAAFERAIELDKNFAMAYYQMFFYISVAPKDKTIRFKWLQKAWELRKRATERERLTIEAQYTFWFKEGASEAAEILEKLLQKYPHDQSAYDFLWTYYFGLQEYEKAELTLLRGLESDSLDRDLIIDLAFHYAVVGRKKEALEAAERNARLAPALPDPYSVKGDIYFFFDEIDSAVYWYKESLALRPDFVFSVEMLGFISLLRQDYTAAEDYFRRFASSLRPAEKLKGEALLTLIPLHQGKYKEVQTRLLGLQSTATAPILMRFFSVRGNDVYHLLALLALETNDPAKALAYARKISEEAKKDPTMPVKGRDLLAIAYLKNGNRRMAYQLLDELRKDLGSTPRHALTFQDFTAGFLAYEEGNYQAAVESFEKGIKRPLVKAGLLQYGVSLLKIGRTDEAIKELKRVTWWVPIGFRPAISLTNLPTWTFWPVYAVKAHYWLGVAYEQKGDRAKAVQEYEKFLDTWKNADLGIPEIADAKQRLERIKKG